MHPRPDPALRIGVHGQVALVQVRYRGTPRRSGRLAVVDAVRHRRLLGHQHRDAGSRRLEVGLGNMQHVGPDEACQPAQNAGQAGGAVFLVDVVQVGLDVGGGARVADIVDVEAQRLGQVVEPMQADFAGGRRRKRLRHDFNPAFF